MRKKTGNSGKDKKKTTFPSHAVNKAAAKSTKSNGPTTTKSMVHGKHTAKAQKITQKKK